MDVDNTLLMINNGVKKCGCVAYTLKKDKTILGSFVTCSTNEYNKKDRDVKSIGNCLLSP